ncbi:hypothetical protein [Peribacillus simplex]|uniref:hypothetical protein n=1 Tax=Peribacillus simplex TaxID=1478 RepID=UPI000F63F345|nr:hypothetical protein [Peribacillus simplex]
MGSHQFKQYADKMFRLSQKAIMAANGEEELAGTLATGVKESQCTYRFLPIHKELKAESPNVLACL